MAEETPTGIIPEPVLVPDPARAIYCEDCGAGTPLLPLLDICVWPGVWTTPFY